VRPAALLLALAVMLGACAGDDDRAPGATAPAPVATPTVAATPDARADVCAFTHVPRDATVESPELTEVSGLAVSRENPGVIWAHNDSGDDPRIFAMTLEGAHLAAFTLEGAFAFDWEDIAIAPGHTGDYLYVGDIGDNNSRRDDVVVYRFREPAVDPAAPVDGAVVDFDTIVLRYPDGPRDAESLLADPATGDLLIITKVLLSPAAGVYRAPAPALTEGPVTLERVAGIPLASYRSASPPPDDAPLIVRGGAHLATAADVTRDGRVVAVRTYATVWMWERGEGTPLWEAFASEPCEAPSVLEPQGEAIAFAPDGRTFYTVSEGLHQPVHQFRTD
jgi:hypothetical protein